MTDSPSILAFLGILFYQVLPGFPTEDLVIKMVYVDGQAVGRKQLLLFATPLTTVLNGFQPNVYRGTIIKSPIA